jgi:predicted metal-dependent hydrolase
MSLPDYTVRRSPRAKHVRLRITPTEGLVVVVPLRFDTSRVPVLLDAKRGWIDRKLATIERIEVDLALPESIELKAIGANFTVDCRSTSSDQVSAREKNGVLTLSGAVEDHGKCCAALRRWLSRQAKLVLVPWLEKLSDTHDLPFRRATVRGQKTRWGSCSSNGTISINFQLLLIEARLANYVLIHELCHTRHLNHGPQFWALVEQLEPDYRALDQRLEMEWGKMPGWIGVRHQLSKPGVNF